MSSDEDDNVDNKSTTFEICAPCQPARLGGEVDNES